MPEIFLDNQKIRISFSDIKSSEIDNQVSLFFKSMGSIFDEETNSFTFDRPSNLSYLHTVLSDTIQFFEIRGWKITLDENCKQLISRHSEDESSYEKALEIGRSIKTSEEISIELPITFKRQLKEYQKKSVKHLTEIGNAANFSVPGSGKTTIAYAAYSILKHKGIVNKIFVVCPRAAFVPWEEEFQACFGYRPSSIRLEGNRVDSHILTDTNNKDLILSTYQLPPNHSYAISQFLERNNVLMILDESHQIKNIEGVRSNVLIDLAPYAKRRFILSGTPMPNSWEDIWTQFNFLWPLSSILDNPQIFRDYTNLKNGLGKYNERINPLFTRIAKKTLNLKEPKYEKIYYPLQPIQKRIYDSIELRTFEQIEKMHVESIVESARMQKWRRAKMVRLIQAASNPALLNRTDTEFELEPISDDGIDVAELIENYTTYGETPSKLQEATRKARELLEKGEKVVIWTNFVHNIDMLKDQLLADAKPLWVDGRVSKDESEDIEQNRERMIQEFKSDSNPRVLIATPASCAESVSLHKYQNKTVCYNAIYIDRTYNAGQYMQSLDRIHRIGMDSDTQVTYWLCIAKDTYDELIDQRLNHKIQNMYNLLNEDINVFDLDVNETQVSESEIEDNYKELIEYLRKKVK